MPQPPPGALVIPAAHAIAALLEGRPGAVEHAIYHLERGLRGAAYARHGRTCPVRSGGRCGCPVGPALAAWDPAAAQRAVQWIRRHPRPAAAARARVAAILGPWSVLAAYCAHDPGCGADRARRFDYRCTCGWSPDATVPPRVP